MTNTTAAPVMVEVTEAARRIYRALEMSAGIMRDPRRTGGWEGAERTASAFERQAMAAKSLHDSLAALASTHAESKAIAFVRRVADMVGDELDAHASRELRDAARAVIPSALAGDSVVDQIAARMAKVDGLNWDEACGFGEDGSGGCDSSTCVAAHYEDHDPAWARSQYRRYARVALGLDGAQA